MGFIIVAASVVFPVLSDDDADARKAQSCVGGGVNFVSTCSDGILFREKLGGLCGARPGAWYALFRDVVSSCRAAVSSEGEKPFSTRSNRRSSPRCPSALLLTDDPGAVLSKESGGDAGRLFWVVMVFAAAVVVAFVTPLPEPTLAKRGKKRATSGRSVTRQAQTMDRFTSTTVQYANGT